METDPAILIFPADRGTSPGLAVPTKKEPSKPIDHQQVPDFIRSHEKKLGWPHRFTCHTFRHAFATYHYEDGTDLLTLKALMEHRSLSSTAVYVHMSPRALMTAPSPLDKMGGILHGTF